MRKTEHETVGRGGASNDGWRERAARAVELRATCSSCGATGLVERVLHPEGKRPQVKPGACACGGEGHTAPQIAVLIGVGNSTVNIYLRDPNREREAARKARYKGTCVDCGGPCDGVASGRAKASYRCGWCQRSEISPYLRENSPTGFRDFTKTTCGWGGRSMHCDDPAPCPEPKRPGGHLCERHALVVAPVKLELKRELKRSGRMNNSQQAELAALEAAVAAGDFDPLAVAA